MTTDLDKLLELARQKPVSKAERDTQRLSFAFGNTNLSNPRITRETIKDAAAKLDEQPVTITRNTEAQLDAKERERSMTDKNVVCRACGRRDGTHDSDCRAERHAAQERLQAECDHHPKYGQTQTTGDPLGPPRCGRCGLNLTIDTAGSLVLSNTGRRCSIRDNQIVRVRCTKCETTQEIGGFVAAVFWASKKVDDGFCFTCLDLATRAQWETTHGKMPPGSIRPPGSCPICYQIDCDGAVA
jgi:hypothetical protein